MKKMKKIATSAILIGIMCGLAGCGDDKESKTEQATVAAAEETATSEETTEEITAEEDDTEDGAEASNSAEGSGAIPTDYAFSSNDWKSLEFALDGEIFTFPMTCADIEAAGFMIDEEYKSEILESNYYTLSEYAENAEGERFSVSFKNFTDTDKEIRDCDIYGVSFEVDEYRDINPDVTLCNGVTFDMTVEEVKAIMGEPDYYYESDGEYDHKVMDYYATGASYGNTIKLSFWDGVLSEITIENKD